MALTPITKLFEPLTDGQLEVVLGYLREVVIVEDNWDCPKQGLTPADLDEDFNYYLTNRDPSTFFVHNRAWVRKVWLMSSYLPAGNIHTYDALVAYRPYLQGLINHALALDVF